MTSTADHRGVESCRPTSGFKHAKNDSVGAGCSPIRDARTRPPVPCAGGRV